MFRPIACAVKPTIPALFAALALTTLGSAPAPEAMASGEPAIQRCEAADGNALYTDKPCAAFHARPVRISDDLSLRLALAKAGERADALEVTYRDASEPLQTTATGRRSAAAGCAQSPQQLSRDLAGAFALHDVNRIAESYHWVGMSNRQALPVMKQLERLSAKPLADARFLAAWIGSGEEAADAIRSDAGLMQLVFAGDGRIVDFGVRRYAGCYFIAA
ncbi:hypothetical protein [Lysobacter yangpyeongensis]|uniref:hypothetical protein n=1 Tax=Lysobacter yangpyeongensis TaxID=346182 RepID=UPI0036D82B73